MYREVVATVAASPRWPRELFDNMPELTGAESKRIRMRNDWSLQYLANRSGINKAYLSEFENGQRMLAPEAQERLARALSEPPETVGSATPTFIVENGHSRLVFVDQQSGTEVARPRVAHLKWTEDDGTTYTMFVGEP